MVDTNDKSFVVLSIPSKKPLDWSSFVEGVLATDTRPDFSSKANISVNVPQHLPQ
ncbi:MAG: hypothetical protein CM15mP85_25220 [Rhodobacterales bacterium]|nr:MAG: hypothetical protein CM15mP85_25220 [Rhodobacterales bacterium]